VPTLATRASRRPDRSSGRISIDRMICALREANAVRRELVSLAKPARRR
jgi:hypothetical protein